ncbi:hypothetical protein MesoLj113a_50280 [Mesorhizobium sp. 113-1-2]|uniref:hypothetical protein n=1 Tax=Mesorhizobium sp. 113-1-2 TaxID=2744515 RepID=UPI001927B278|nr:hypothetical protein [Mesorhizobium sp. 113-1-2]BCG73870.1 hypothetical protein MesoLj113a_50280 [Mesorhizobium sp. 113-1-2]
MAVAKKDQERANYAWMYGAQARKDGKERAVPPFWQENADVWLHRSGSAPQEHREAAHIATLRPLPGNACPA